MSQNCRRAPGAVSECPRPPDKVKRPRQGPTDQDVLSSMTAFQLLLEEFGPEDSDVQNILQAWSYFEVHQETFYNAVEDLN